MQGLHHRGGKQRGSGIYPPNPFAHNSREKVAIGGGKTGRLGLGV